MPFIPQAGMAPPTPDMGGFPPELLGQMMGAEEPPEEPQDPAGILREILDLAGLYRDQESDEQNLLLVEKLRTIAQQILANEQKEADGMLQGKLSPSAVRRMATSGPV